MANFTSKKESEINYLLRKLLLKNNAAENHKMHLIVCSVKTTAVLTSNAVMKDQNHFSFLSESSPF